MSAVMVEPPPRIAGVETLREPVPDLWTTGLDVFLHQLRHPEDMFGDPCGIPALNRYPMARKTAADELRDYFSRYRRRCMDAYARLLIAAGVLRIHDVRICQGPLELRIWYDECDACYVDVIVSVDADRERTKQLAQELLQRSVSCSVTSRHLHVLYESVHAPEPPICIGRPLHDLFNDGQDR